MRQSQAPSINWPRFLIDARELQTYQIMSESIDLGPSLAEDCSKHTGPAPVTQDAVFGEITEEGPNYRDVSIDQLLLTIV